jgi:hypothetical protein
LYKKAFLGKLALTCIVVKTSGILFIHMKVSSGEGTKAGKFELSFYGSTEKFSCGKTQDVVLNYIKRAKGGRGGCFKVVLKDGSKEPFLDDVFTLEGEVTGYEFVPEEVAPPQQGK